MTSKEFKRVARILKASYKKVEENARKSGMDLMSKDYEALIDKVRLTVLKEMGFTLDEYRRVKAKVSPGKESEEVREAESIERTNIPFSAEMEEIAESVARKIIPPPQTLKQIFQYDDSGLKASIKKIQETTSKFVSQEELHKINEELKSEILTWHSDNFSANFQKNIDMMGMPDFRKLAMGLQAQIDDLSSSGGSGDVVGPASATDNRIATFDGATGKLIQDSGSTIADVLDTDNHTDGTTNKVFTATEQTKLAGIETGADVTDTDNVTAAGALMDSEVDADIKTLSLPANTTISAFGASIIDDADEAAFKATVNLEIGVDVQAYDADLTSWAGKTAPAGDAVGTSDTQTLTNKRITKRTGTTTSSATPTINTDNVDEYYITAQAEAITSFTTNLSGTPTLGQGLFISVIGTAAREITWGASFANGPVALPTTTVTTTQLSSFFKWDGSVWRCYATGSTV